MPGQFVQSYRVELQVAGSGDGVHESDVELTSLGPLYSLVIWVPVLKNSHCTQNSQNSLFTRTS